MERQTQDFMNIHSFSQLPFLRAPPPSTDKGIRLFGQEFCDKTETTDHNNNNNLENSRRFECHYCCRSFPTSQALGGHQNAHKRERQHAKRHLQSTRFGSTPMPSYYSYDPSYTAAMGNTGRFYRNYNSYHPQFQPINGSPLGSWRIPAATTTTHGGQSNPIFNREHLLHRLPLFSGDEKIVNYQGFRLEPSCSKDRFCYDPKPTVNDHVSLDLHL